MLKNSIVAFILICVCIVFYSPIKATDVMAKNGILNDQIDIDLSSNELDGYKIDDFNFINNHEVLIILSDDKYESKKVSLIIVDVKSGNIKSKKTFENAKNATNYTDKIYILFKNEAFEFAPDLSEMKKKSFDLQTEHANFMAISNDGKYIAFVDIKNSNLCLYCVLTDKIVVKKKLDNIPEQLTFLTNTTIGFSMNGSWNNYKTLDVSGAEREFETANINFNVCNKNGIAYSNYPEYSGPENDSIVKLLDQGQMVFENTGISNKGFFGLKHDGQIIIAIDYFNMYKQDYNNFILSLYDYDTLRLVEHYKISSTNQELIGENFDLSPDNKKLAISKQLNISIINLNAA